MSINSIAMSNVYYNSYNYTNKANSSDTTSEISFMPNEAFQQRPEMNEISDIDYENIKNFMMSDSQGQRMNMQGMQDMQGMQGMQGAEGAAPPPPPPPPPPSQLTEGTDDSSSDLFSSLTSALDGTDTTGTSNLINSLTNYKVSQEDLDKYDTDNDGKLSQTEQAKMDADKKAEQNTYSYISNAINTYTSMSNLSYSTVSDLISSISA